MNLLTFEKMTEADLDAVSSMEARTFSMPWTRDDYKQMLVCKDAVYVVAKEDGAIVGSHGVRNILSEGEITNVMVDKPYRGRAISYPMLMELLKQGEAIGIKEFFLEVRQSNEPAIKLYTKCGFQVEGVRKNLYERPVENGLIMWKR